MRHRRALQAAPITRAADPGRIVAPRPQNSARQPSTGISHCTGSVDATMPIEPVINIQELVRNWVAGSNQRLNPVRGAIRQALTPTPHRTRAATRGAWTGCGEPSGTHTGAWRGACARWRLRTERLLADSDYLAREIAALRLALGEVATRDYIRSELRDLLDDLDDRDEREAKSAKKKKTTKAADPVEAAEH